MQDTNRNSQLPVHISPDPMRGARHGHLDRAHRLALEGSGCAIRPPDVEAEVVLWLFVRRRTQQHRCREEGSSGWTGVVLLVGDGRAVVLQRPEAEVVPAAASAVAWRRGRLAGDAQAGQAAAGAVLEV